MKKFFFFLLLLPVTLMLKAQDINASDAWTLINKNMPATGLSKEDLGNVIISNAYNSHSDKTTIQLVYLQQTFKGLLVYHQIQVLGFKDGSLFSNAGTRIPDMENKSKYADILPSITAGNAVRTALNYKKINISEDLAGSVIDNGKKISFGKLGIAHENVTAELMWVPVKNGKEVRLAWQVYLVPLKSADYWEIRIDAKTDKLIDEDNLTIYCDWNPADNMISKDNYVYSNNAHKSAENSLSDLLDLGRYSNELATSSPAIVNSASYRVVPFPAESPKHSGGTPVLKTDPWNAAPGNATSLKWHSNGTTDYNITRGNNAWAKEDHASNNSNNGAPATSITPTDPLSFDFVPNFQKQPNQTSPVPNQQFNITNLFYWINTYHDITYQYGFDEPAGNFQANNQGRGGAGNDYVFGDAQDGNYIAPNQDNANFSSPADGSNGRMQMYLWDTVINCIVNSPSAIAGSYLCTESAFSLNNKLVNVGPVTGQLVYFNDNMAGTTHDACTGAPANALTGKIALINRGTCNFTVKVKSAQDAGAIAVIMVNNVAGYLTMAGDDQTITIPAILISQADGAIMAAQLANNVNVTLHAENMDGDVDNGIIMHEHSHGISNRLTGGPTVTGCLSNVESMGEGWSDYYALMLTQDWATSNLNTGFTAHRGIGTYVIGQGPTGAGIRTYPYTTDMSVNLWTYAMLATNTAIPVVHPAPGESHLVGEIWCATLWDMTWNIINQVGTINPNMYNPTGGGGNTIALKLVTEGMKLQPCSPGFIDGRNAILRADTALYGGLYSCAIKEAFRRRGMGANASQGSSASATDQVADFAVITACNCTNVNATTQPVSITACTGTNVNFTVAASGTTPTFQWQVSTNGGTTYTNIPGATSATLSLTGVTASMNNNLYQVIITNSCPSNITSSAATLTVTDPAAITSQPASLTVCTGANATFNLTASGTSVGYQWQVSTDGGINFANIPGATAATLDLGPATAGMNGNLYNVLLTSCNPNPITSSTVTLTVNSPASISSQPANTNACTGTNTSISVTAAGSSLTYQWQVSTNGGTTYTNIAGATAAILNLTAVTSAMNNNLYQVIISSTLCPATVTSSAALLVVADPASISAQPADIAVCAGANASFTVIAAGSNIAYQWQVSTDNGVSFTDIPGATSATLTLTGTTSALNNNQYHVVVFSCSPAGLNSNAVTLTVNSPAGISGQPANVNACTGTNAAFTIVATGTGLSYQWQVSTNGGSSYTDIAGATNASLILTGVTAIMNNNLYQVIVNTSTCPASVTSSGGLLTVSDAAVITSQPSNTTVCEGANATFTASATGSGYQWQVSTDNGTSFTNIAGANTTTLNLPAITAAMNANQYQLVVTSCGASTITTSIATLTVNTSPAITVQPVAGSACIGSSNTFCVTATGTGLSYQWQISTDGCPGTIWTNIAAANTNCLTLNPVTAAMNNFGYRCIVTGICVPPIVSDCAVLTVNAVATIDVPPASISGCPGSDVSFNVSATGTGLSYQWQVSTNGGTTFTDINGQTTAGLTLSGLTSGMNNNQYHVLVFDVCSASGTVSAPATLTVFPAPIVTISASPYLNLTENLSTTLTATSTPSSATFSWYKDGNLVSAVTGNTFIINHDILGEYNATVTDANGCTGTSNLLTIGDSTVNIAFIYPNPNTGHFQVKFKGTGLNGQSRIITMYDAKGSRVYKKAFVTSVSYEPMEVFAEKLSSGVYVLILSDVQGNTLGTGKVVIL